MPNYTPNVIEARLKTPNTKGVTSFLDLKTVKLRG